MAVCHGLLWFLLSPINFRHSSSAYSIFFVVSVLMVPNHLQIVTSTKFFRSFLHTISSAYNVSQEEDLGVPWTGVPGDGSVPYGGIFYPPMAGQQMHHSMGAPVISSQHLSNFNIWVSFELRICPVRYVRNWRSSQVHNTCLLECNP